MTIPDTQKRIVIIGAEVLPAALTRSRFDPQLFKYIIEKHRAEGLDSYFAKVAGFALANPLSTGAARLYGVSVYDFDMDKIVFEDAADSVRHKLSDEEDLKLFRTVCVAAHWLKREWHEHRRIFKMHGVDQGMAPHAKTD